MLHTRCTKLPAQNFSSERSAKTQAPQLVQKNLEFHNNLQHRPQNFVVLYSIFRQKLHLSLFRNEETNPVQVRPFFSFDSKIVLNFKGPILTTSSTPLFGKGTLYEKFTVCDVMTGTEVLYSSGVKIKPPHGHDLIFVSCQSGRQSGFSFSGTLLFLANFLAGDCKHKAKTVCFLEIYGFLSFCFPMLVSLGGFF